MEHPAYFIENYCQIEDKDTPGVAVPFALWDGQREALQELAAHKLNIILKARLLGITWLVLAYAVHLLLKTPGATVIAISRTEEEAKEYICSIVLPFAGDQVKRKDILALIGEICEVGCG